MRKDTWVCFNCRTAERIKPSPLVIQRVENVKISGIYNRKTLHVVDSPKRIACRKCGKPTVCIGDSIQIPKRKDVKKWQQLHGRLLDGRRRGKKRRQVSNLRLLHRIEKRIRELESLPLATGNAELRKLKKLKMQIDRKN